jgi:hypothetical protein
MSDIVHISETGFVRVVPHKSWLRTLAGVALVAVGLGIIWRYLIGGIVEFARAGDYLGIATGLLGWIVISLVAGFFFVPGWILAFVRRIVELDPKNSTLTEIRDYLVHKKRRQHPVAEFSMVIVLSDMVKKFTRSRHTVQLTAPDKTLFLVAAFETQQEADTAGRDLAQMLAMPFRAYTEEDWISQR